MSKYKPLYLCVLLLFVFASCEKEADNITLPEGEPKLVVYSYISPSDSLIEVEVSKAVPYFGSKASGNENELIENAFVQLASNDVSVQLPLNNLTGRYTIVNDDNFKIRAGQSYSLFVSTPDGLSCSAKTTVPSIAPQNIKLDIDSTFRNDQGFEEVEYRIIARWNDIGASTNYYHHSVRISTRPDAEIEDDGFILCNNIINDEGNDGKEIISSCNYTSFSFGSVSPSSRFNGTVYVLTSDFSYYKFHESYYRYDGENPFAEPVQIYTNIEGGLGCFGSYLETKVSIR